MILYTCSVFDGHRHSDHPVTTENLFECGDKQCAANFTCKYSKKRETFKWKGRQCSVVGEGFFPIANTLWSCPTTDFGRWIQGILFFVVLMLIWVWFNTVLIVEYDSFDMFMQTVQVIGRA